jgi:hypothetical protein
MFSAHTAPTTGLHHQRHALFPPCSAIQAGGDGCGLFLHAPLSSFSVTPKTPKQSMAKRTAAGNPASAQPMKGFENLSKRAQALLKPTPNQVVLEPKGGGIRRLSKVKASI